MKRNALILIGVLIVIVLIAYKWRTKEPVETAPESGRIVAPAKKGLTRVYPEITSVKLTPLSPVRGDAIKAEALIPEGVTVAYQWAINSEILPEAGDTLVADFKNGDKISLTVTPFTGREKGTPVTLFTYISNSPPVITSVIQDSKFVDRSFTYQLKASDPDNDTLTYSFKSAVPEGMTIYDKTGLIKWTVPSGFKGRVDVMVSVSDGAGGEASQIFNLQIDQ